MLAEIKFKTFQELVKSASREELVWMNGFLSALLLGEAPVTQEASSAENSGNSPLNGCSVVYGTETGNSKKVATDFGTKLKKNGILVKVKSLDQYRLTDLTKETCLLVVLSTQGDGEPPAAAKKFYDYLLQNQLSLSHLSYGVLALGDSGYPLFCKAGEDVDLRLEKLGANRLLSLRKCDTDFETDASEWMEELLAVAKKTPAASTPGNTGVKNKTAANGKKIYQGTVLHTINLNDRESAKETYHLEIHTEAALNYEPGDSIGIIPANNKNIVDKVLALLELEPDQTISYRDITGKAAELFTQKINLQYMPERIVEKYARLVGKEIPAVRMDFTDLLRIYPCDKNCNIQEYINLLEPIVPRLYSIASSPLAHGENEVHITVSRNIFSVDGHTRYGLCSDFLSQFSNGSQFSFYIQKNQAFRIPSPDKDIIMIGPGTGIAPFRSFLYERDGQGATGRNWLFFGEQHFVSDFLYQTELQSFYETGTLTRLNTAFSRDQAEKIYVQHRMLEHADELYDWIRKGAGIYVCGAKEPMSRDVEDTLIHIIADKAGIGTGEATQYLLDMHEQGSYHKDVY